jgi:hypothetical protein|tara:strand:+ start:378 stop:809 length:432 start_codon:yes stop_codon:yes gene_type:complete
MAITTGVNNQFKSEVMLAEHNLQSNTLKVILVSSSQNVSAGGPNTYASVTSQLANGNGYTTGGETLATVSVSTVDSSGVVDFADVSWSSATFSANGCVIYNDSHSSKSVIAVYDFGGEKSATNGEFKLVVPAATSASAVIRLN